MLQVLLYVIFVLASLLLIAIILLQEGKGGGLSDAFGGAGTETFGVRAGGINRFTFGVFAVFILSAMLIHWTSDRDPNRGSVLSEGTEGVQPTAPPGAGGTGGPVTPPPGNPGGPGNPPPPTGGTGETGGGN